MATPAIAAAIETPLDALRQAAEGHQRVPAARLAEQAIEDHPGEGCQHQAHWRCPQLSVNSSSCNGRGVTQPSSTSIGSR
ncbi:hypothetical protein D3C80_2020760 [compost metagenome]